MLRSKSIAMAIALLLPTIANATTWYMKPIASGSGDCSSWANACAVLATAKNKVATNDDEIWVAAGIYEFSAEVVTDKVKVELNPPNTLYVLKIYGGFEGTETAVDFRNPTKNVVVFSGDTPVDDTGVSGGVTPSYNNVGANATSRFLRFSGTGVTPTSPVNILDGITITGMNLKTTVYGGVVVENAKAEINNVKFTGNKGHAPGIYVTGSFSTADLTNLVFTNNYSIDDVPASNSDIADGGAIYATGANVFVTCDYCAFNGNRAATSAGAVRVISGANISISNSGFTGNISDTAAGGALLSDSVGVVNLDSNLFDSNVATAGNGGAMAVTAGTLNINSNTFFANTANAAGKLGGAINFGGGTAQAIIKYSTFMNNAANGTGNKGGAINVNSAYLGVKPVISHSLFLNNTTTTAGAAGGPNISDMGYVTDGGYNMIGYNSINGVAGTWTKPSTSQTLTEPTLANIIETTLAANGGQHKSLKLALNSIAKNAVPNDVTAGAVGTTPTNPFTSMAQARGAMASYSSYDAGRYFFNLGGTTFGTYVDKDGYVLVASANSLSTSAAAYTQVTTLDRGSDSLLTSGIMAKFTTAEIDEVRISSASSPDGSRGTFDGYSVDPDVINSLRTFSILNNPFSGGTWNVKSSSKSIDYFSATCVPTAVTLANGIYHACGNTSGMYWIPSTQNEALTSSTLVKDDLELWVRSSLGNCNGTVSVDQRGLPRSDYVNPNDPNQYGLITACDIGGFEWNNGYQLDCWNEDGMRPENSLSGGTASVCFSDFNSITPKALFDNFGFINWHFLFMLSLFGVFRNLGHRKVMRVPAVMYQKWILKK